MKAVSIIVFQFGKLPTLRTVHTFMFKEGQDYKSSPLFINCLVNVIRTYFKLTNAVSVAIIVDKIFKEKEMIGDFFSIFIDVNIPFEI